jgi:hypothetical protein
MSFVPPNESELEAVQKLQSRLACADPPIDYKFSDTSVLRFYRGRKRDEENAYKALVRHYNWRVEHDVDNIEERKVEYETELLSGKCVVEGYDKEGRPAVFVYARKHSKYERDVNQIKNLIIYTMETILKRARQDEQRIIICFDLTGFTLACMDYEIIKMLIHILEFNYPETLASSLIINSPFMFYACWAVIRPWLDPVTAAKVNFVSTQQVSELITATSPNAPAEVVSSAEVSSNVVDIKLSSPDSEVLAVFSTRSTSASLSTGTGTSSDVPCTVAELSINTGNAADGGTGSTPSAGDTEVVESVIETKGEKEDAAEVAAAAAPDVTSKMEIAVDAPIAVVV